MDLKAGYRLRRDFLRIAEDVDKDGGINVREMAPGQRLTGWQNRGRGI